MLDIAEVIEMGLEIFGYSKSCFLKNCKTNACFQIVREFSFIQKGISQLTQLFNIEIRGVFRCPRWTFGWTQKVFIVQALKKLPTFKEDFGPKAEVFCLPILNQMIDQCRA